MELKDLKVGDRVLVSGRYNGGIIAPIEKITPKGSIRVRGTLFNSDTGYEKGGDIWSTSRIQAITPKIEEDVKRRRTIYTAQRLIKSTVITYEKAVKIIEALKED